MTLAFTVSQAPPRDGACCLRLAGELDLGSAPRLIAEIDRLHAAGERRLLLDLTELTFCDSAGIAAFVRADNAASVDGGWVRITGAAGRVDRVLRITGVAGVLGHQSEGAGPAQHLAG